MNYVVVKNWKAYQHYHDRGTPSWIKFYTALLNPVKTPKYADLSDGAKLTLLHIWLLAAQTGNKTPVTWINRDRLNMKTNPKLQEVVASGLVSIAESNDDSSGDAIGSSDELSLISKSESPSASSESEMEREFDLLWAAYPKPIGRKQALRHFLASVTSAEDLAAIQRALEAYKTHCAATEDRFIQHGKTWFNNWRDWLVVGPRLVKGPDGLVIPEATVRDRFVDGPLDCYAAEHGRRPNEEPARGEWDARFEAYFGFTPDQFKAGEVTDSQMAEWLRVRA